MKWTERMIGRSLAIHVFQQKNLVVIPNCNWPGNETDILIVTPNLRIIDVEIKVSRADLRADFKKDKWFHDWDWKTDGPFYGKKEWKEIRRPRQWPERVWKHYYAMPKEIWAHDLYKDIPPLSGVLLLWERDGKIYTDIKRRAKPCRDAQKICAEDAIDIARLASIRMWSAYDKLEREG